MERRDNYATQSALARQRFLTYDQETLIQKLNMDHDEDYLYQPMLSRPYRIHRRTGDVEKQVRGTWQDGNSFAEVLTLLDLICDSRPSEKTGFAWKSMASFGNAVHQNLLEPEQDPWAEKFQRDPEGLRRACLALSGRELHMGDICYDIAFFKGLHIRLSFWFADEEFPPMLRFAWNHNALRYIRYETMYYAKGLLLERIAEEMA